MRQPLKWNGGPGSDTSDDPIEAGLQDLIDPWALDPTAGAASDAEDGEAWFDKMDPAAIATACDAGIAAFVALDTAHAAGALLWHHT